jgi:hypothetical protein
MPNAIVWLEDQPVVTVDATGVRIEYVSGGELYIRRCTRAFMRRHCETALFAIDEYEAAERSEVVPIGKARRRH